MPEFATGRPSVVPMYARPRARIFDPATSLYANDAQRLAIRQALGHGLANAALVPLMCIGDSETAGWKGTPGTDDPVTKLRNQFTAAGFPVTGGWIYPGNGTTTALDNRWAFSGTWQGTNTTVNNYLWTTVVGATATLSPDLPGTVAEFIVFSTATQNIDYSIDGGATTTVSVVANALRKFTVTGLTQGLHTIKITKTSAVGNTLWIGPGRVRNTTGLTISNAGIYGAEEVDWLPTALTSGYYNPYNITTSIETPKLVLMGLGTNAGIHSTGSSVATMTTNLGTIITALQGLGATVVLKTNFPPADSVVNTAHAGKVWTDYAKGMWDAADNGSVALIEHTDVIGTNAAAQTAGMAFTDNIHPLPPGYAAIARRDFRALTEA